MGNCINKSASRHDIIVPPNGASEDQLPLSPKATSNSSVATTACITPLSTSSVSSPPRQPASPDRLDALVSSVAIGSPMSPTINNNNAEDPSNDQRTEGQQQLRDLVVTGAEAGEIDWKSIIKLAEDLHKKEQQQLRSSSSSAMSSSSKGGKRTNTSKRQAFFERRRKRKELARRKKRESVGSFSVNLVIHDEDKYRTWNRGEQTNTSMSASTGTSSTTKANACAVSDNNSGKQTAGKEMHGSESEEEIDVFEDDDSESLSSSKAPLSARHSRSTSSVNTNKPQFIVEGSFMAATTLFDLPKINDDEDDSSSSSNSSTASDTFGRSFTNDGLVTIHEDSSVSTWQQQWQQYLR